MPNIDLETYPDHSLYSVRSMPALVERINNAFVRKDQIEKLKDNDGEWFAPIVADGESGFGGAVNAYELMRKMIESGVSAVHFEDQLALM